MRITIPLPPAELKPNARPHFHAKAKRTREYRHAAFLAGIAARNRESHLKPWESATVQATFYFRDKRKRDRDNLLASLKAAFDGIADADVVINDSELTFLPVKQVVDKKAPRVELEVLPTFCDVCGCELEWFVTHECPPGFTEQRA